MIYSVDFDGLGNHDVQEELTVRCFPQIDFFLEKFTFSVILWYSSESCKH